ncbi:MAG: UDP-glucose 4-epimerase GalE [Actinobacteria bacterium]|nr:UDP-glucose 4-epimerase GalE [Actinomycetota bacterium]NBP53498.1 UDP-glucose 4-epimerase GalE [Actinomycetota bacterium]
MTVLVTGGAGYIGSHTVRMLRDAGRDVVVLDSLEMGHEQALLGAELVVGEIADFDLVSKLCRDRGVTSVIHFAAYKSVGESMTDPFRYFSNNVGGSTTLIDAVVAAGVEQFVFSSSAAIYGSPARVPVTEDLVAQPESVYAETKWMIERVLAWIGETRGLRSVCLRYFNAAGASFDSRIGEDWSVTTNLVPIVMKATLGRRGPLEVFGNDYPTRDGTGERDYIHVVDLAEGHVRALDYLDAGKPSLACNLGTGHGNTVLEVLAHTARISGREVPHVFSPRRAGDPAIVFADPSLAERELGWKARYGIKEILQTAWTWHSTHIDGFSGNR